MAERPILFSGPMVQAILAGRKTQTRRVLKPQPLHHALQGHFLPTRKGYTFAEFLPVDSPNIDACTPFQVGDLLRVREAWRTWRDFDHLPPSRLPKTAPIFFEADRDNCDRHGRYRHARFMPRWASRITLRVTAVKVERLQEISEDDAIAEGIVLNRELNPAMDGWLWNNPRNGFKALWSSINGPDSWEANPWVAAYTFERVKP